MRKILVRLLIFIIMVLLMISSVFYYIRYNKYKEIEQEYCEAALNNAFQQLEIAKTSIEAITTDKNDIADWELINDLSTTRAALQASAASFLMLSTHFKAEGEAYNGRNFTYDLILLYEAEISSLQVKLLVTYQRGNYDEIRENVIERLTLLSSDLQSIAAVNNIPLFSYNYDEFIYTWIELTDKLEYREITKIYKLKYKDFFDEKHFFLYNKKLMQNK